MAKQTKDITACHFPVYAHGFPKKVIYNLEKLIGTKVLASYVISGTEIIKQLVHRIKNWIPNSLYFW
jgi:phosphopentomutase